jgi:hypothetical protein
MEIRLVGPRRSIDSELLTRLEFVKYPLETAGLIHELRAHNHHYYLFRKRLICAFRLLV